MHDFAGRKRRGLLALSVADPAHVAQVFIKVQEGEDEEEEEEWEDEELVGS